MTQPEKEQTVDDVKVEQAGLVFEVCVEVTVLRCDGSPLDEGDREEALDVLSAAVGDASDLTFTFVGDVFPRPLTEPDVEEVQAAIHAAAHDDDDVPVGTEEPEVPTVRASKKCTACHAQTTQLAVNQCPMCGNPFT